MSKAQLKIIHGISIPQPLYFRASLGVLYPNRVRSRSGHEKLILLPDPTEAMIQPAMKAIPTKVRLDRTFQGIEAP